jgi:hypothetical protein
MCTARVCIQVDIEMIEASVCIILRTVNISLVLKIRLGNENLLCVQMHLTLGWTTAIVCFYMAVISPVHMASRHYVYNSTEAANFAAFAPVFWCLFTAWIIFVSYIGHGGMCSRV